MRERKKTSHLQLFLRYFYSRNTVSHLLFHFLHFVNATSKLEQANFEKFIRAHGVVWWWCAPNRYSKCISCPQCTPTFLQNEKGERIWTQGPTVLRSQGPVRARGTIALWDGLFVYTCNDRCGGQVPLRAISRYESR